MDTWDTVQWSLWMDRGDREKNGQEFEKWIRTEIRCVCLYTLH